VLDDVDFGAVVGVVETDEQQVRAAFVSCGAYPPVRTSDSTSDRVGSTDCELVVSAIDRSLVKVSPSSVV
jgi:hypothetical protein